MTGCEFISPKAYLSMSDRDKEDVVRRMTTFQKTVLDVSLRKIQEKEDEERAKATEKRLIEKSAAGKKSIVPSIGVTVADNEYVRNATTPFETSRRIRELCSSKTQKLALYCENPRLALEQLARYERDAQVVSNMRTMAQVKSYLYVMGYDKDE